MTGTVRPGARPLVVGIGNEHRGDDAVGLLVARLLRPRLEGTATVVEFTTEGTELLDLWDGVPIAIAVDSLRSGSPAGSVLRWESGTGPLPAPLSAVSSHAVSIGQAVALGEALGRLPSKLVLFGVEGVAFDVGDAPTPPVVAAVGPTARRVEEELRSHLGRAGPSRPGADRA